MNKPLILWRCLKNHIIKIHYFSTVQAAVERAKQLREERKRGTGMDDSEHTFTPQINQRPSYLNKTTNDSLDMLASNSQKYPPSSNDIFEQPLPGNRPQPSGGKERERERDSGSRGIPSPTSDALGNEMKRFPQRERAPSSGMTSNSSNSNSFREYPSDPIDSYTSNERLGSAGSRSQQQQQQQPRSQQRDMQQQQPQQQQARQAPQLSPQKPYQKTQYQQPQNQFQNNPQQQQQKYQQQQQQRH